VEFGTNRRLLHSVTDDADLEVRRVFNSNVSLPNCLELFIVELTLGSNQLPESDCTKALMFGMVAVISPVETRISCQMRLETIPRDDGGSELYRLRVSSCRIEKTTTL
jgi:hypothetical protein